MKQKRAKEIRIRSEPRRIYATKRSVDENAINLQVAVGVLLIGKDAIKNDFVEFFKR